MNIFRKMIGEGEASPRFFLPVEKRYDLNSHESWFFLLAPFVLCCKIIGNAYRSIWWDLMQTLEMMKTWLKEKAKEKNDSIRK